MSFKENDILLEKALSYGRLVVNFTIHLILSLIVGPLIAVFLFAFYSIAYSLEPSVRDAISQDKLVGYWFLLIVVLMFGLVWLGFINNRKNDFLASQKCQRWYYEYWNTLYGNVQDTQKIPSLPSEASRHYEVRTIAMDKNFPRVLALVIILIMSPIMFIFIFFSPSLLSHFGASEAIQGVAKIAALSVWATIFLIALVLEFFYVRKTFFKPNLEHYVWRQFWVNLILVTLMNDTLYSSIKGYETSQVNEVTSAFSGTYKNIYDQITTVLANQNNTLNADQLQWLESMITYLEDTPGFLIPTSISLISKFYTYALIVAGTFSSVLLGPANYVLNTIIKFLLG